MTIRHGFVQILINLAKEKGFSAYIGEGLTQGDLVIRR